MLPLLLWCTASAVSVCKMRTWCTPENQKQPRNEFLARLCSHIPCPSMVLEYIDCMIYAAGWVLMWTHFFPSSHTTIEHSAHSWYRVFTLQLGITWYFGYLGIPSVWMQHYFVVVLTALNTVNTALELKFQCKHLDTLHQTTLYNYKTLYL